jgi:hypothetical protein
MRGDDQHHYAMLMPGKAFRRIMAAMAAEYSVIVLRAWRTPQGVIIRVLTTNGTLRNWVVFGSANLVALLESLIAELEAPDIDMAPEPEAEATAETATDN